MAYLVPAKAFLEPSSDMAMLFAPFGCTQPPPPAHLFCSHRIYLPRTLPEVTSEAEILTAQICASSTPRVKTSFILRSFTFTCYPLFSSITIILL